MAEDKLSAREAALIAQARAQLAQNAPAAAAATRAGLAPAPAERAAPGGDAPAVGPDPAERIAALLAAARAESERQRQRQRRLYVWAPVAFMSVLGLWTLLWLWHML